ncbi:hypothetical protein GLX27_003479 [Malassezia furfur]|uniref:Mitochondrial dicarboxylate transporter n=1 Tax=Malassezia furfur TaxID=55194 RepID=A0ABY8ET88_MALFU|nr:hypothetical protein CBS14141_003117 [Malassezia furfur]WFD48808.1 hypothetical protein GLX27_003479 [Malassezia furfur]
MASTDAQPVRGDAVSQAKVAPKRYPFWLGGVSASIAVLFTHPLDLTKLRMQNAPQKTTTLRLLRNTIQNEGVRGLYIGISASVLRQMTYSLTRFAAYEKIKERFIANRRGPPPLWITITTAGFAGAAGGLAGNPADVILVRMTGDMYRPPEQRFNYRGAANGLARITKEEGLHTLFRGLAPNMVRAALMNSSQLASYDFFKDLLRSSGLFTPGSLPHYLGSSLLAGTVATTICSPADVVRARLMNARGNEGGMPMLAKSLREEGPRFLFRGWLPSWMRLAPQTVILLTVLEELRALVDYLRDT